MNTPRLKAIHNAILSGIAAGNAVGAAIAEGRANDWLETLQDQVFAAGIETELKPVRNMKPLWSRFGTLFGGLLLGGFDMWTNQLFKKSIFGTLPHKEADFATLSRKNEREIREYERPDGVTTFDRAASVYLANLSHDEDQPIHLVLDDPALPIRENLPRYGEPAPLYCPAGVYEVAEEGGQPVFRINAANCVHCKTCDIKDPAQNINWVPPEGGSGPNYRGM